MPNNLRKKITFGVYWIQGHKILIWFVGPSFLALGTAIKWFFPETKWLWIIAILWAPFWFYVWRGIVALAQPQLQDDDLELLLSCLDKPVKKKKDRFLEKLKKMSNKKKNYSKIFQEITRPEIQIEELLGGVYGIFQKYVRKSVKDAKILVVLFEFCQDRLGYLSYYPADRPCSSPEELNREDSCVRRAKDSNNIVIVDDIEKELQKRVGRCFVKTSSGRAQGSIICYPIFDARLGNIKLVLSIYCDEAGLFVPAKERIYIKILEKFADRILIEYALLILKDGWCYG